MCVRKKNVLCTYFRIEHNLKTCTKTTYYKLVTIVDVYNRNVLRMINNNNNNNNK